ncbi:hypothetical protein cypCar_00025838 [Cyprinus carpio]|nr:hypothetical protein cypCar_00025838 [Cyprinus carpio]
MAQGKVPIIPTFLYATEHQTQELPSAAPSEAQPTYISIFSMYDNNTYTISTANLTISSSANGSSGLNGSSVERHGCKEDSEFLEEENVRVGLLFASKALVQLMVNPFVGPLTNSGSQGRDHCSVCSLNPAKVIPLAEKSLNGLGMLATVYTDDNERGIAMGIALGGLAMGVLIGAPFGSVMYEFVGKSSPFLVLAFLALFDGGMVDSSMMAIMGYLVDIRHMSVYGSVYAIADVALCMGFAIGPSTGGAIVRAIGFPNLMVIIGIINILYAPLCFFLKNPAVREEKMAIINQECPMHVKNYNTQREYREFPLSDESEEDTEE